MVTSRARSLAPCPPVPASMPPSSSYSDGSALLSRISLVCQRMRGCHAVSSALKTDGGLGGQWATSGRTAVRRNTWAPTRWRPGSPTLDDAGSVSMDVGGGLFDELRDRSGL